MESQPSLVEMALIALASGTHRLELGNEGEISLVEREEPEPEVYYNQMRSPKIVGNQSRVMAFICPTPYPNINLIGVPDENTELGFTLQAEIHRPEGNLTIQLHESQK